jgi:hypothetical protein
LVFHHRPPFVDESGAERRVEHHTGVVDEGVDSPEPRTDLLCCRPERLEVADVGLQRQRGLAELFCKGLHALPPAREQCDPRTPGRERARGRLPDAARRAGDYADAAAELAIHLALSIMCSVCLNSYK